MEPLKPDVVARILNERPNVTHSDIEEYHRLQVEHFTTNPFVQKSPEQEQKIQDRQERMQQLYYKIYGD